jgi:hypothetical protein
MRRLPPNPFRIRKLSARTLITLLLCALLLLLLGVLKNYHTSSPLFGPSASATPLDPHLARGQLLCTLEATDGDGSAPAVRVTVTNFHAASTVALLLRDSPFADDALARGAFDVLESGPSGRPVVTAELMMSGGLPPFAGDDFVEILPFHALTKDVHLLPPVVQLESGKNYTLRARGRWRAVWHARVKDYDPVYLQKLGGATGLIDWTYASNTVEVSVK